MLTLFEKYSAADITTSFDGSLGDVVSDEKKSTGNIVLSGGGNAVFLYDLDCANNDFRFFSPEAFMWNVKGRWKKDTSP